MHRLSCDFYKRKKLVSGKTLHQIYRNKSKTDNLNKILISELYQQKSLLDFKFLAIDAS